MKPSPDLSIVIPAFNEEARLLPTLESYLGYCTRTGRRVEMIVVDDGSLDRTSMVVNSFASSHGQVRLIRLAVTLAMQPFANRRRALAMSTRPVRTGTPTASIESTSD